MRNRSAVEIAWAQGALSKRVAIRGWCTLLLANLRGGRPGKEESHYGDCSWRREERRLVLLGAVGRKGGEV